MKWKTHKDLIFSVRVFLVLFYPFKQGQCCFQRPLWSSKWKAVSIKSKTMDFKTTLFSNIVLIFKLRSFLMNLLWTWNVLFGFPVALAAFPWSLQSAPSPPQSPCRYRQAWKRECHLVFRSKRWGQTLPDTLMWNFSNASAFDLHL